MAKDVLEKIPTGIEGFDKIAHDGIPKNRTTLIAGTSGSGKTVFGMQFLIAGIKDFKENGVFITFEETPFDLVRNFASLGWDIENLADDGKLAIVDGTPDPGQMIVEAGIFDLSAMMARIEHAIKSVGAERVVIDTLGAFFPQFSDPNVIRKELHRVHLGLRRLGVTTMITVERTVEDGDIGRFGVEEFVADNVCLLRNRSENERRRRTIEILKFRGSPHMKGEFPFTIDSQSGVNIIPLSAMELRQESSTKRVSSGVVELDEMCNGGMYRDSVILASGATGSGKTLLVTHFVNAAISAGEKALIFGSEESREQLTRNADGWGIDFEQAEKDGLLRIVCQYPEATGLEDHLLQMRREIEDFGADRVAVDSMSAFERSASTKSFREFVIGLTSHLKQKSITSIMTNTTSMLMGGESITETHISSITDTIILLRYVEIHGEVRRGITVLKMRGTWHEKNIREYTIDETGMHVGNRFKGIHGILSGDPTYTYVDERQTIEDMFTDGSGE